MKNKVFQVREKSPHKPSCYSIFYLFVFQARRSFFLNEQYFPLVVEELDRLSQTHAFKVLHAYTEHDKLFLVVSAEPSLSPLRIVKVIKGALGKKLRRVINKKVWEEGYQVETLAKFP